jgi:hypothetical protein
MGATSRLNVGAAPPAADTFVDTTNAGAAHVQRMNRRKRIGAV